jgi:hypothetical protein
MARLKGSTARQANLILGRTGEAFWQDEWDEVELDRIARYVEHNPVSAGLAANPRHWPWSSARLAGESASPVGPGLSARDDAFWRHQPGGSPA